MPATAKKIDLFKDHAAEYAASRKPALVTIAPAAYLAIEGRGEPGGSEFQRKIGALYAAAYTVKMTSKSSGRDYAVCKLEGLWWTPGKKFDFGSVPRALWCWKLLIRTPGFISRKDLARAVRQIRAKGKDVPVEEVRLETLKEGRCVQALHVGPYDRIASTVQEMKALAAAEGVSLRGLHHEVYLSDPRRAAPEKLRTILRCPVGKS